MKDKDIVFQEGNQYKRASVTIYHPGAEELRDFLKDCLDNQEKVERFLDILLEDKDEDIET